MKFLNITIQGTKGGNLLLNKLTNNHTVMTTDLHSDRHSYGSLLKTATYCDKTVCTVNCVIKKVSEDTKICFNVDKSKDLWIINSGALHHITNELSDFSEYRSYQTPEEVQTANKQDSLTIHGEGTVFLNTEMSNGQIHTVHLYQVCYIPNGSNQLLSRGQLCFKGLVETADAKSTTFSLPKGCIFLRGFPRHSADMYIGCSQR